MQSLGVLICIDGIRLLIQRDTEKLVTTCCEQNALWGCRLFVTLLLEDRQTGRG